VSGATIELRGVAGSFVPRAQGGAVRPAPAGAAPTVRPGEGVALSGPSGLGKSTLMRAVYGDCLVDAGVVRVAGIDVATASPREIPRPLRETLGHVSQFLRVTPQAPAREVAAEPPLALGRPRGEALAPAEALPERLGVPERLRARSPMTVSGGERQRVNVARGFAHGGPALPVDEPIGFLDPENRAVALATIAEAMARGAAVLGMFHDAAARAEACDREIDLAAFAPGRAAA